MRDQEIKLYPERGYGSCEVKKYTLEEVAERLSISIYTIRRRVKEGRLPADKLSGKYWVTEEDIQKFVERESVGKELDYFTRKGERKKKDVTDVYKFDQEVTLLVEGGYALANTEVARIYYERSGNKREDEKHE